MFMFVSVIRSRVIRAGHDDNEDGDCSLKLKHQLGTMLLNTDKFSTYALYVPTQIFASSIRNALVNYTITQSFYTFILFYYTGNFIQQVIYTAFTFVGMMYILVNLQSRNYFMPKLVAIHLKLRCRNCRNTEMINYWSSVASNFISASRCVYR